MNIRCNWCMSIFEEKYIITSEDNLSSNEEEYCPICKKNGCLMDNPPEVEIIKKLKEMKKRLSHVYDESTLGDIPDINSDIDSIIDNLESK